MYNFQDFKEVIENNLRLKNCGKMNNFNSIFKLCKYNSNI